MKVMLKHKQNPPLALTAEVKVSQRYLRSLQKKTQLSNTTAPWPLSGTTQVSRYQKCKTNQEGKPAFTGTRDSEWQWHQLCHMQICTSQQTDNQT